jgi:hypothetical protein
MHNNLAAYVLHAVQPEVCTTGMLANFDQTLEAWKVVATRVLRCSALFAGAQVTGRQVISSQLSPLTCGVSYCLQSELIHQLSS